MEDYQGNQFIGIVEYLRAEPSYDYCGLNQESGGSSGFSTVGSMGSMVAYRFGKKFRQQITYEPPQGIDERGTERNLCPRRYHALSVLERDRFEKAVLRNLRGEE